MLRLLFFRPGGREEGRAKRQKRSAPALRALFGGVRASESGVEGDILLGTRPAALGGTAVSFLLQDCAERV